MLIAPEHPDNFTFKQGEYTVAMLKEKEIGNNWTIIRQVLEKHPEMWEKGQTLPSLRLLLDTGAMVAWVVMKNSTMYMILFTIELEYPACKSLQVVMGAGKELGDYLGTIASAMEAWAHRRGCKYVEVVGRKGWERRLAQFGYSHLQCTLIKELTYKGLN